MPGLRQQVHEGRPLRQLQAAPAHMGVVAGRQRLDEIMSVRRLGGTDNVIFAGVRRRCVRMDFEKQLFVTTSARYQFHAMVAVRPQPS